MDSIYAPQVGVLSFPSVASSGLLYFHVYSILFRGPPLAMPVGNGLLVETRCVYLFVTCRAVFACGPFWCL